MKIELIGLCLGIEAVPLNTAVISITIEIINLLGVLQNTARSTIVSVLSKIPHISATSVTIYHEFVHHRNNLYCNKYFYVEMRESTFVFSSTRNGFDVDKIAKAIEMELNENAIVTVEDVITNVDWKLVYVLCISLPIVLVVGLCTWLGITWRQKQQERNDNLLLLA